MDQLTVETLISLTEIMCVVIVAAYLITRDQDVQPDAGGKALLEEPGGPFMDIGAGLIGGIHRLLFVGGDTTLSCSLATIFAGIFGTSSGTSPGRGFQEC